MRTYKPNLPPPLFLSAEDHGSSGQIHNSIVCAGAVIDGAAVTNLIIGYNVRLAPGTIVGDTLVLLFNADEEVIPFTLPTRREGEQWELLLDTFDSIAGSSLLAGGAVYQLQSRTLALFWLPHLEETAPPETPAP